MWSNTLTLFCILSNNAPKKNQGGESQTKDGLCETLYFDKNSKILPITLESITYVCRIAAKCQGLCKYALCETCHDSQDIRRSRKATGSSSELNEDVCSHDLSSLILKYQLYNSRPESIGTKKWFDSPNGCFRCKGMFVIGQKQGKGNTVNVKNYRGFPDLEDMDSSVANHYKQHRNKGG